MNKKSLFGDITKDNIIYLEDIGRFIFDNRHYIPTKIIRRYERFSKNRYKTEKTGSNVGVTNRP